jgi:hypothetical protein
MAEIIATMCRSCDRLCLGRYVISGECSECLAKQVGERMYPKKKPTPAKLKTIESTIRALVDVLYPEGKK